MATAGFVFVSLLVTASITIGAIGPAREDIADSWASRETVERIRPHRSGLVVSGAGVAPRSNHQMRAGHDR